MATFIPKFLRQLRDVDTTGVADGDALVFDDADDTWKPGAGGGGVSDHGLLTGLADDDHAQYLKEKASGGTAAEVPEHTHASAGEGGTINYQPNDADLTAIAALATTAFGRGLLTLANQAALLAEAGAAAAAHAHAGEDVTSGTVADARIAATIARDSEVTAAIAAHEGAVDPHPTYTTAAELAAFAQPLDSDLTAIAALTTTAFGRSLLEAANAAALRTLAGLVIGTDVPGQAAFDDHSARHEDGGGDEISIAGLAGTSAALQAHLDDAADAHDASAVSVVSATLSGVGTDAQAVLEEIDNLLDDHSARHESGGADAIKLDDLAATDDNTDLNASSTKHGLLPKLSNVVTEFLNGQGAFTTPAGGISDLQYESRSTNTILGTADKGKAIDITATITQTFSADETLGDGWWVILRNATDEGTVVVTLDPAGTETIDGLTTVTMYSGEARLVICNGAGGNFNSILLEGGFARFTTDQNFIVPHGITQVTVECIGGGGGGAGARGGAAGSIRKAGSGGGGGARTLRHFAAAALGNPGDPITVDVAAGGTSGAGGSSANGSNGVVGANTTFGSLLTAFGGGAGLGGESAATTNSGGGGGGAGEVGTIGAINVGSRGGGQIAVATSTTHLVGFGGAGGGCPIDAVFRGPAEKGGGSGGAIGQGVGLAGGTSVDGGGGGGGGASVNAANAEAAGGAGGLVGVFDPAAILGGGGAANAGAGANGAAGVVGGVCGTGGAGGGSQDSGTGGAGGNGGAPGGGGGGGGAGTTVGGAGGAGGIGECRVFYS